MRILALCPFLPFPPTHGGRIRSGVMLRALAETWHVELLAPVGDDERDHADALEQEFGVGVHRLPVSAATTSKFSKVGNWLRGQSDVVWRRWSDEALARAHEIVRYGGEELVIVDGTFAAPLLPGSWGGRLLVGLHNVEAQVVERLTASATGTAALSGRIEVQRIAKLEQRLVSRAALTVVVSESDRNQVESFAPHSRVEVIENSVDTAALRPLGEPRAASPTLLFVGSFDYPPNREAALDILERHAPALTAAFPDVRIRLVGRDPTGEIEARAESVEGVEVLGFVDDLADEYAAAAAVFVPLRSGGGTRIKILEAFAFGRPVIATELAVEGLGLDRGKHYLPCETEAQGVASARAVFEGAVRELVDAGRRLVERRYAHEAAAARWVDLVRSLT